MNLLRLKVTLVDTHPPIWRELVVPAEFTLAQLHRVLQTAMGWEDAHMHRFLMGKQTFSDPRFELDGRPEDERKIQLGKLLQAPGASLLYEYDFGDGWQHRILCNGILVAAHGTSSARCIGGAGACPPEDCGGPYRYAEMLEAFRDERHPEHKDMREWLGPRFNPGVFSADSVNKMLSRLFRDRASARKARSTRPE